MLPAQAANNNNNTVRSIDFSSLA